MAIHVVCRFCNFAFEVDGKHAGHSVKCPTCSGSVVVSSGLDFVEDTTGQCPMCGREIEKSATICPHCSNEIRSSGEIRVEELPDPVKRPMRKTPSGSFALPALILFVLLGVSGGIYLHYGKADKSPTSLGKLVPENTPVVMAANLKQLRSLAQGGSPGTQDLAKCVQGQLESYFGQLFPAKLGIRLYGMDQVYWIGNDWRFFAPCFQESRRIFAGAVLVMGEFDGEKFQEYEAVADDNMGLEEKYGSYSILRYQSGYWQQKVIFTLLDPRLMVAGTDIDLLKKIADLHAGKGTPIQENLELSGLWQFRGQFAEKFFEDCSWRTGVPQNYSGLVTARSLSATMELTRQNFSWKLQATFPDESPVQECQKNIQKSIDRFNLSLPEVLPKHAVPLRDIFSGLAVEAEERRLTLSWQLEEARYDHLFAFVHWMLAEPWELQLQACEKWQELDSRVQIQAPDIERRAEEFLQFLQAANYTSSPYYEKASNLLQTLRQQAKEDELQMRYRELTRDINSENELSYWPRLREFAAANPDTGAGRDAALYQAKIAADLLASVREKIEKLQEMEQTGDFSLLGGIATEARRLGTGADQATFQLMAQGQEGQELPALLKTLETRLKSVGELKDAKYRQLLEECREFIAKELPAMVAGREFDSLNETLQQYQVQLQPLQGEESLEWLDHAVRDVEEIRSLFSLVTKEFQSRQRKNKDVEVKTVEKIQQQDYFKGQIMELGKTEFTVKSKGKTVAIPYRSLQSGTLATYISSEDMKDGKVAYYMGLLLFYEGKPAKIIGPYLKDAKKRGYDKEAESLLQKLKNR